MQIGRGLDLEKSVILPFERGVRYEGNGKAIPKT
jgi:hypothetical protein